jgi:nicotinamide phosphoribosyltransferase
MTTDNKPLYSNLLLLCDSYKVGMDQMYPPDTEYVYSYIESRGGPSTSTLFFGLQIFLKTYMCRPITQEDIDEADEFWTAHGEPFNRANWEYILKKHDGWLPLEIKAVPEGMHIPLHNVLATVVNTDPKCHWLTTWVETLLLQGIWYPTTVATNSWRSKMAIKAALEKSCDNPEGELLFRMHDFGFRGTSSVESAAIGGAAHLVNFMGTDTAIAAMAVRRNYGERMAGYSIPASEHSVICMWGKDNEAGSMKNMLDKFAKEGAIVACVSDTYDIYNAVNNIWGGTLKENIEKSGATLVVRPDSGDPLVVPVEIVKMLSEKFGYTINSKGYKVLPKCVRVIQGDGITVDAIPLILDNLLAAGFSAECLGYGQGGGLLQKVDRDTFKFAMKASAGRVNGEWREVFKDPVTDKGKRSKKGRFVLTRETGKWETLPLNSGYDWADVLVTVYRNGKLLKDYTFAEIRARSNFEPLS